MDEGQLSRSGAANLCGLLEKIDHVLGILDMQEADSADADGTGWIEDLIAQRTQARKDRDFPRADEIRDELKVKGVELIDTAEGTKWKRVPNS